MPEHTLPHPDLAGFVLGVLDDTAEAAFAKHLGSCSACRAEVAELSSLPDLLRRAAPAVGLPPDLRKRTMSAIDGAPAREMRPRSRVPLAALAAAIAVTVGAAFTVVQLRDDSAPRFEARLVAVDGASGTGEATLRPTGEGVVIDLEVAGLAPEPAGEHYECWYVSASDPNQRVSAGSFVVGPDGEASVRMVTAADPQRFPRIEVTLEPADGNPLPGAAVLVADSFLVLE